MDLAPAPAHRGQRIAYLGALLGRHQAFERRAALACGDSDRKARLALRMMPSPSSSAMPIGAVLKNRCSLASVSAAAACPTDCGRTREREGCSTSLPVIAGAMDDAYRQRTTVARLQVDVEGLGQRRFARRARSGRSFSPASATMSLSVRLPPVVASRSRPSHSASVALT